MRSKATRALGFGLAALLLATVGLWRLDVGREARLARPTASEAVDAARADGVRIEPAAVLRERVAVHSANAPELGERSDSNPVASAAPEQRAPASAPSRIRTGLHGRLFDQLGEPAVGYKVRIVPLGDGESLAVDVLPRSEDYARGPERETDEEGVFEFPSQHGGVYQLWAFRRGGPAWPGPRVDLLPNEETAPVEFFLSGHWVGPSTEILVVTGDGDPVPDAVLKLRFTDAERRTQRATVRTDARGSFLWAGYEGEALAELSVATDDPDWCRWESGNLEPGLTSLVARLEPRAELVLSVRDTTGAPVELLDRVEVRSQYKEEQTQLWTTRAEGGAWSLPLPTVPFSLTLKRNGYATWDRTEIDPAEALGGLTVVLERAPTLRVRARGRDGRAAQGVPVALLAPDRRDRPKGYNDIVEGLARLDEEVEPAWTAVRVETADADGRASFPLVEGELYRAGLWDPARGAVRSAPFVAGPEGVELTLALTGGVRVEGRFVPPAGSPIEDCELVLLGWRDRPIELALDEQGRFSIAAVPPGAVNFRASWSPFHDRWSGPTLGPYPIPDTPAHELIVRAIVDPRVLVIELPALAKNGKGLAVATPSDPWLAAAAERAGARLRRGTARLELHGPGSYGVYVTVGMKRDVQYALTAIVRVEEGDEEEVVWSPPLVLGELRASLPKGVKRTRDGVKTLRYLTTLADGTSVVAQVRLGRVRIPDEGQRVGFEVQLPLGSGDRLVWPDGFELPVSLREGETVDLELPAE